MMQLSKHIVLVLSLVLSLFLSTAQSLSAEELLDGRVFTGKIGPEEKPDLSDSLHFSDGHFWSDICRRCGFLPGSYSSELTEDGITFTGILKSESRGQFDYQGLVREDGSIVVSIQWERRRWYWTSRREIAFRGMASSSEKAVSLEAIRKNLDIANLDDNPLCARF